MLRRLAALATFPGLLLIALAVPGTVLAGDPCFHSLDRPAPTTGSTEDISIGDCVFLPTVAHVPVGATVDWKNASSQEHEVVGANLTWGAHDKLLQPGDTIGWTFDEPGVYAYSCMLHPGMTGAIVVGETSASSGSAAAVAGGATETGGGSSAVAATTAESGTQMAMVAVAGVAAVIGLAALAALLRRRGLQAPDQPETDGVPTVQQG